MLTEEEMAIANGNTIQIININSLQRKIYEATEVMGVGVLAIPKTRDFIAVGECGRFPNIYIYEYPSMRLYRILRKGTENAYSALSFSHDGKMLASVGSDPDYNIILWNWRSESIVLKSKAFSQEVYSVSFSDNFDGKLISSGMGHIKYTYYNL